jgi:hypothetical protein
MPPRPCGSKAYPATDRHRMLTLFLCDVQLPDDHLDRELPNRRQHSYGTQVTTVARVDPPLPILRLSEDSLLLMSKRDGPPKGSGDRRLIWSSSELSVSRTLSYAGVRRVGVGRLDASPKKPVQAPIGGRRRATAGSWSESSRVPFRGCRTKPSVPSTLATIRRRSLSSGRQIPNRGSIIPRRAPLTQFAPHTSSLNSIQAPQLPC